MRVHRLRTVLLTLSVTALFAGGLVATAPFAHADDRLDQTITFGELADKTLAESPIAVDASASPEPPVTFSSPPPTICPVLAAPVPLVAAGTSPVQADQDGDEIYSPAPPVQQS